MSGTLIEKLLTRLQTPSLPTIELSLGRMEALLAALGNPERRLPPVIHVAGTNGKGSLLAYLHSIYTGAGYKVQRYISPHLVRFNERIRLGEADIADEALLPLLKRVEEALQHYPATAFEAETAVAMLAFAEHKADLLLLETGLGGRLDATNIMEQPILTAIMPVGIDHAEFLGNTLESIAYEKAGIMKRGTPCVISVQEPQAIATLHARAAELGVQCFEHGHHWRIEDRHYRSSRLDVALQPSLAGEHQFANAATAIACCEMLQNRFPLTAAQMEEGLRRADWPARLQLLPQGALTDLLPPGTSLWLDGGHNPHAAYAVAQWAQGRQPILICGMLANKDSAAFMRILAPHFRQCVTLAIPGLPNSASAEALAEKAQTAGMQTHVAGSIEEALAFAAGKASDVLIGGSLYLAGQVLRKNNRADAS